MAQTDQKLLPWVLYPALAVALYLAVARLFGFGEPDTAVDPDTVPRHALTDADADAAGAIVAAVVAGEPTPAVPDGRLGEASHGVYVALRAGGQLRGAAWQMDGTVAEALAGATREAGRELAADRSAITTAEVCLAHSWAERKVRRPKRFLGNIHRGIHGLELRYDERVYRYSPTEMIARNLSFGRALERLMERHQLAARDLSKVDASIFDCDQLLVGFGPTRVDRMERGNTLFPIEGVTADRVRQLEADMGRWMTANLHPDGRMTYKWWPSRGEESPSNNMIRQWMASIALVRLARYHADPAIEARALANIRYNLANFYVEEDGFGLIDWGGQVKLGAVSLAALAIMEHPARDQLIEYERALRRTTFELQQPSGRFRTFYRPDVDRNHNFYPGETQLYWTLLYLREPSPELLERIMKSFRYYRTWHRDNRNPAFIPWHTQAYVNLWFETRDQELADWVFEMNDWLLSLQEWDRALYPDTRGRFYDQQRSFYGPPHASSTGVYLEGLIDAFRLARELGDADRTERYRRAIVRGLRSLIQLQFVDAIDMFYIQQKDRVRGGLRTTVYDNAIRVDNVQHGLLGIFRINREFAAGDFAP